LPDIEDSILDLRFGAKIKGGQLRRQLDIAAAKTQKPRPEKAAVVKKSTSSHHCETARRYLGHGTWANCLTQSVVFLLQSPSFAADVRQKNDKGTPMNTTQHNLEPPANPPSPDGEFQPCPTIMTEEELVRFLRIPEISSASDHRNVIENLKRKHGLPRIHLCGKAVYLTDAVKRWLQSHVTCGQ
jgi:hypothetical protein